jgi:O-antigen/teichoic acid export membrane protein
VKSSFGGGEAVTVPDALPSNRAQGECCEPTAATIADKAALETQKFRSHVGQISRQSGVFFIGTVLSVAFGYIFKVYLARVLGPENLGVYALGMTLIGFLEIFNALGLAQSAVRFVASYVAAQRFAQLHSVLWRGPAVLTAGNVLFAVVLLTLGRPIASRLFHSPALVRYLPWFAVIMLFGLLNGFFSKVLAGYRDLGRKTVIQTLVGTPLTMLATVLLVGFGLGLGGYLAAQVVGATVVCVLLIAAVRKLTPAQARYSAQNAAPLDRAVWSFSAAALGVGLLEFVIGQADKVALGVYRGTHEVGIYAVAAAMVAYVPLVLQSVNQIFAPTIADLHTRGDHATLARLFQSLTKWVTALTFPLGIVIIVFARPLMRIFGAGFEMGWPILIIGTLGQLINCGVGSVGYLLLMSGNEKRLIKVQAVMAAVMIFLNIALVPILGMLGAALAAAITNAGMNLWNLMQVRAALRLSPYNRSFLHLLPPAVASTLVTLLLRMNSTMFPHEWLAVAVSGVLGYATFAGAVFAFGLSPEDRLITDAIWARIREESERSDIMTEMREIRLPAELCLAAERKFGGRFANVEELLTFVLKDLSSEDASGMDRAEQHIIEERLRDLGYI